MRYKVGDNVRINSLEWYNSRKNNNGDVYLSCRLFRKEMSIYCDTIAVIESIEYGLYRLDIDHHEWAWNDSMFNDNIKNEIGFIDITNELYRVYCFENGCEVRINNPTKLNVSKSGGHRILDAKLISHYIPYKWNHLYWEPKSGCNNFVK